MNEYLHTTAVSEETTVPPQAPALAAALEQKKPWMLSSLARECQVSEKDVARALPPDMCAFTDGENFTRVWEALCAWEKATFIVQHEGHVIEVACRISAGRPGHGYYNIMGDEALGGHIRADAVTDIAFLSMPFMGLESHSVQFFNAEGAVVFSAPVAPKLRAWANKRGWVALDLVYALLIAGVFLVSACFIIKGTYNPFIYFNF